MLSAWIPLVDVDETMGAMGYVPGTHDGDCEYVDIFGKPGSGAVLEAKHGAPTFVAARAGDVIFHAARTAHMARANRSTRIRKVHTAIYFAGGCTRAAKGDHPSLTRNGTAPGKKIEGPPPPIPSPLPDGRLPAPAPWPALGGLYRRAAALGV